MGRTKDGASKQKKGKAQAKEKKGRQAYCAIFIDDYYTTDNPDDGTPVRESNLLRLYKLYTDYKESNAARIETLYLPGPENAMGPGFRMGKTAVKQLLTTTTSTWLGFPNEFSAIDNLRESVDHIQTFVDHINRYFHDVDIHFDFFGAGRGAFVIRSLAYLLNIGQKYTIPEKTRKLMGLTKGTELCPLKDDEATSQIKTKEIRMMGLFDTVASIGTPNVPLYNHIMNDNKLDMSVFRKFRHDTNVVDFGQFATETAKNVLHIGAMDEMRHFYPFIDIENSLGNGTEILLPGCHNDIVGGNLGGIGFITKQAVNLGDEMSRELDNLTEHVTNLGSEVTKKDVMETSSCRETYSFKGSVKANPQTLSQCNDTLTKANDFYYSGELLKFHLTVHNLSDWFDNEVKTRHDWDHSKNNSSSSKNIAKMHCKTLEKLGEQANYMAKHLENITEACEDILKNAGRIPGNEEDWRKIKSTARNACDKTIRQLRPETTRMKNLVKFIEDFVERIENEEDWIFGDEPNERVLPATYPFKKPNNNQLYPICGKAIRGLGWVQEKVITEDNYTDSEGHLDLSHFDYSESATDGEDMISQEHLTHLMDEKRVTALHGTGVFNYTKPGYSLIPLKLMWQWCKNIEGKIMARWPNEYKMPKDLQQFYNSVSAKLSSKGRAICCPDDSFNEGYRVLRCKYLQFSLMDYSPAFYFDSDAASVDSNTFNRKDVIVRRVYSGKQGGCGDKFMYNYSESPTMASIDFNPELDDHWIVTEVDGSPSKKGREAEQREEQKRQEQERKKAEAEQKKKAGKDKKKDSGKSSSSKTKSGNSGGSQKKYMF